MWRLLVGLGFLLALAGLVVVALGVAIFVSSFGNTLVATGAACLTSGLVLAAVGLVLREVMTLSARLDAALAGGFALSSGAPAAQDSLAFDEPDYEEEEESAYEPEEEPEPIQPPRSYVPPTPARQTPIEPPAPAPEPRADFTRPEPPRLPEALQRGRVLGRTPEGESFAQRFRQEPVAQPPVQPPVAPAPHDAEPERTVTRPPLVTRPFTPPVRRPEPPAAPPPVAAPEPPLPPAIGAAAAPEPTVLKSGVVGGMAYTLYSDGSIQAELPDGTLRFASLQELRDHVARTSRRDG